MNIYKDEGGFTTKQMYDFLFDGSDEDLEDDVDAQVSEDMSNQVATLQKERDQYEQELRQFKDQQEYEFASRIAQGDVTEGFNSYRRRQQGLPTENPSDKGQYAFNYLQQKGIAPHVAAGIVGNLEQESGDFRDDVISGDVKGDYGTAVGIAQWRGQRHKNLVKFGQETGRDPYTLDTQLDYLVDEGTRRGDIQAASKTDNSADAAYIFAKRYERPKTIDQNRIRYAQKYHP